MLPPPPPPVAAYICLSLNLFVIQYYQQSEMLGFLRLTGEDRLIENLTAVFAFLASILLFVTGRMERKALPRWIYIMGGIVALFVAGEEISWGQRILGYPTPDWMIERNSRKELNLHNLDLIEIPLFLGFVLGTQLLCTIGGLARFADREKILGIPLPPISLVFGFMVVLGYTLMLPVGNSNIFSSFSLVGICIFFIVTIVLTLLRREYYVFILAVISVVHLLNTCWIAFKTLYLLRHSASNEALEYLITLGIFLYSLKLLLNQRPFIRADHVVRRWNSGPAVMVMRWMPLLALGIYIPFQSYQMLEEDSAAANILQEIASREPIIRSHFNVYLSQNRLIYHREACSFIESTKNFFLLVIPTDPNEFPIFRIFSSKKPASVMFLRKGWVLPTPVCFATYSLPRWEIAHIYTGQEPLWGAMTHADRHVPDGGVPADRFERATNCSINDAYRRMYDAVVSREPRVRSDFDIYFHDRTLIFVKKPCLPSDVETAFFLHVVPVDNASLPSFRQQYRYDNLDFRFSDSGRVFDDKCMAIVSLPAYDIDRIVSGQYTSEKRLWQVEFPAHTVRTR